MPRKPGGKYKGKVGRAKGETTIAAELEAKRRKLVEANLAKLQERRAQELLAAQGLQSNEEEAQALKLAKIAQMFGTGKKGTLKKFWKNWKIGLIALKKDRAVEERKTCWRRSCIFCDDVPVKVPNRHGQFSLAHSFSCGSWWKKNLGRSDWGQELHPIAAANDRPDVVNEYRQCQCCGADTGLPGLGCRCWHALRDVEFRNPSETSKQLPVSMNASSSMVRFADDHHHHHDSGSQQHVHQDHYHRSFLTSTMASLKSSLRSSSSAPTLRSPTARAPKMSLSAESNWALLRDETAMGDVPEYDPTEPFALSPSQAQTEDRRAWSDELSQMAGSPWTRQRSGQLGRTPQLALPPIAPEMTDRGETLHQVSHWRTGQKTMLDAHMMKMYVVGVQ